ncbi:MAG TPA: NUDIX domain-containing protein [Planctomycetota bacterium]|nr:NUDIX domain-containing protein [Planctomycetota bacterium]
MKTERSAGLIIFRETGGRREYLLVRSGRHGAWGFPKGHVEPGETDEAAARRETAEEAGLSGLDVLPGFGRTLRYPLPGKDAVKEAVYLLARAPEGSAPGRGVDDEIAELRWAGYRQALGLLTFANTRGLLEEAEAFLNEAR